MFFGVQIMDLILYLLMYHILNAKGIKWVSVQCSFVYNDVVFNCLHKMEKAGSV